MLLAILGFTMVVNVIRGGGSVGRAQDYTSEGFEFEYQYGQNVTSGSLSKALTLRTAHLCPTTIVSHFGYKHQPNEQVQI